MNKEKRIENIPLKERKGNRVKLETVHWLLPKFVVKLVKSHCKILRLNMTGKLGRKMDLP